MKFYVVNVLTRKTRGYEQKYVNLPAEIAKRWELKKGDQLIIAFKGPYMIVAPAKKLELEIDLKKELEKMHESKQP